MYKPLYSTHTKSLRAALLKMGTRCPTLTLLVTVCFLFCLHVQYVCLGVHIDTSELTEDKQDILGRRCYCLSYSFSLICSSHQFSFLVHFIFLSALFLIYFKRLHVPTSPAVFTSFFGCLVVTFETNNDSNDEKARKTKPMGKLNRCEISVIFAPRLASCQNCSGYVNIATMEGLLNDPIGQRTPEVKISLEKNQSNYFKKT